MLVLVRASRPGLRLVDRNDVGWMRAAGLMASPIAPGINQRFTTVLGDTVYLPGPASAFPPDRLAAVLAHELVHQLDQGAWGPWFYLSYACFAPVGRTARAVWERRAYAVDLMLAFESGGRPALDASFERVVGIFSGPSYLWMWAGRAHARQFLEPIRRAIEAGSLQREAPYDRILAAWRGSDAPDGEQDHGD